jgi:hypothetical protein
VVLASGEVREVVTESGDDGHRCAVVGDYHGWGTTPPSAIAAVVGLHGWPVREILAPGEMTRAELAAQLAAVTAERDALAALRPRDPHRTGHRCACCGREGAPGADDVCPWCSDGMATQRERDVARAQQAPLVACVDALRAAATAAGWRDADATGEHLVAWVRRGAMRECLERAGG